jgi:hypothetical protein
MGSASARTYVVDDWVTLANVAPLALQRSGRSRRVVSKRALVPSRPPKEPIGREEHRADDEARAEERGAWKEERTVSDAVARSGLGVTMMDRLARPAARRGVSRRRAMERSIAEEEDGRVWVWWSVGGRGLAERPAVSRGTRRRPHWLPRPRKPASRLDLPTPQPECPNVQTWPISLLACHPC